MLNFILYILLCLGSRMLLFCFQLVWQVRAPNFVYMIPLLSIPQPNKNKRTIIYMRMLNLNHVNYSALLTWKKCQDLLTWWKDILFCNWTTIWKWLNKHTTHTQREKGKDRAKNTPLVNFSEFMSIPIIRAAPRSLAPSAT